MTMRSLWLATVRIEVEMMYSNYNGRMISEARATVWECAGSM
jgi:hypothetical protein